MKTVAALSLVASASAFAPAQTGSRVRQGNVRCCRRLENIGSAKEFVGWTRVSPRDGSGEKETWTSLGKAVGSKIYKAWAYAHGTDINKKGPNENFEHISCRLSFGAAFASFVVPKV